MKRWQTPSTFEDLRFPEPNTFIPSDFSLRCDDPDFQPSHEDWSKLIDTAKGESPEAKVFEEEASKFLTSVPKLIRRDDLATVWVQTVRCSTRLRSIARYYLPSDAGFLFPNP